jgi:hypothetical protein
MSAPIVVAVSVTPTLHTRLVVIECPYCERRHSHGWPYGTAHPGLRTSHCTPFRRPWSSTWQRVERGSYFIAAPVEARVSA